MTESVTATYQEIRVRLRSNPTLLHLILVVIGF